VSFALLLATVSKVPFYIAGGALACWAVLLAAMGLRQPEFPKNLGGERAVIGISLVLAVVAIAMAVKTSTFGG
jgi:hypothetical protein